MARRTLRCALVGDPPKGGYADRTFAGFDCVANLLRFKGRTLQRLFSTFAGGWPGIGLLLLRLLTALALVRFGIAGVLEAPSMTIIVLQSIGVAAGILLIVGLWTPVAGAL